jgi:hypothetical protein
MSQVQVLVGWRCHAGAHGRSIMAWCQAARSRAHEPQRPGAGPDRGRVPNVCAHETAPECHCQCRVHASSSLGVCLFPLALTNWLHSSRPLQELSTARPSRCRYPYRTQTLRHTLNTSHDRQRTSNQNHAPTIARHHLGVTPHRLDVPESYLCNSLARFRSLIVVSHLDSSTLTPTFGGRLALVKRRPSHHAQKTRPRPAPRT